MINVVSRTIQFSETQPAAFPLDLIAQKHAMLGRICNYCYPTALGLQWAFPSATDQCFFRFSSAALFSFYDFKAHA